MKALKIIAISIQRSLVTVALLAASGFSHAEALGPLVDDFSDAENNSLGVQRQFVNDSVAGGGTTTTQSVSDGVLLVAGEIAPPRGQPGWASSVLLLDPEGLPRDASAFDGIRLRVKVNKGNLSISANSTEVTNFDYHAAQVVVAADGKFHEVKIPFASMKRAWSEQTPLNSRTIASLSLVAFDVQQGSYDFEVDEVAFY
jgi:hypothetical protein